MNLLTKIVEFCPALECLWLSATVTHAESGRRLVILLLALVSDKDSASGYVSKL